MGPLGGKWRPLVGKVGEWYVENWHLQGCSLHLCRLRTDGLAPASKYWIYRSHTGVMRPVSRCSCVTTWPKPLSPTPRLSRGMKMRRPKTSSGCRGMFHPRGDYWKVTYVDHVRCMVGTLCGSNIEMVWRVDQVFPYRVYIDSNHRDSWIWVTACLRQSSCSNLMISTWLM
jgi:hypothetical protein